METERNRFKSGKIYTIRSPHVEYYYIGSTCQPLCKRFHEHNQAYNSNSDLNKNSTIRSGKVIFWGDAYIELLENFPCKDRNELLKREGELIREHGKNHCIVNKNMAGCEREEHEKVECGCGSTYVKKNAEKHKKTMRHEYYEKVGEQYKVNPKKKPVK